MEYLWKLHLDCTAITKLSSSIENLTNLASLNLRNCKDLVRLPKSICNFKLLKDLSVAGCSKLEKLPENLWNINTLEMLDVSGVTIRELASSFVLSRNLKRLRLRGCEVLQPMSFLLHALSDLRTLIIWDLSDCNLLTIPCIFGYLSSLQHLNLSGNNFECLPRSIIQLSNLNCIYLRSCTRLHSLPQLPSSIANVFAEGCTSLETLPNVLHQTRLYLFNCFRLAENQGWTDMFFTMLSGYAQGIYKARYNLSMASAISIVIPGSEIPRWFSHHSEGTKVIAHVSHLEENVNIQFPSHSYNKWIGMLACTVFQGYNFHPGEVIMKGAYISINKSGVSRCFGFLNHKFVQIESDHLWLLYIHPEWFSIDERAQLSQTDDNGFVCVEVSFDFGLKSLHVGKKCGFRMVYERDIEGIREMMAQSSQSSYIVPYEGSSSYVMPISHNLEN